MERVETGTLKFEDDWTGVFIRGDDAFSWSRALELVLKSTVDTRDPELAIYSMQLQGLLELLRASNESNKAPDPFVIRQMAKSAAEVLVSRYSSII